MSKIAIRINEADVVAVALQNISQGTPVTLEAFGSSPEVTVTLTEDITAGHKFAVKTIKKGEPVIKYGYPIGQAKIDIEIGQHVHTHNIQTLLSEEKFYTYDEAKSRSAYKNWQSETSSLKENIPDIKVYRRKNGKIGIRNELWIVPLVGCVNKICENLSVWANNEFLSGQPHPSTDGGLEGVFTWTHPYGCSQMGGDKETTARILSNLVHHPNAGAVLVVSLGCEENNIPYFKNFLQDYDEERVKFLTTQECSDELAEGKKILAELAEYCSKQKREKAKLSEIVLGMKCGGSDGMSGITANSLI